MPQYNLLMAKDEMRGTRYPINPGTRSSLLDAVMICIRVVSSKPGFDRSQGLLYIYPYCHNVPGILDAPIPSDCDGTEVCYEEVVCAKVVQN